MEFEKTRHSGMNGSFFCASTNVRKILWAPFVAFLCSRTCYKIDGFLLVSKTTILNQENSHKVQISGTNFFCNVFRSSLRAWHFCSNFGNRCNYLVERGRGEVHLSLFIGLEVRALRAYSRHLTPCQHGSANFWHYVIHRVDHCDWSFRYCWSILNSMCCFFKIYRFSIEPDSECVILTTRFHHPPVTRCPLADGPPSPPSNRTSIWQHCDGGGWLTPRPPSPG